MQLKRFLTHVFALQEYEKFGAAFEGKADVVIAKVDADQFKELGSRFSVQGFPTLKFFVDGTPEEYAFPYVLCDLCGAFSLEIALIV